MGAEIPGPRDSASFSNPGEGPLAHVAFAMSLTVLLVSIAVSGIGCGAGTNNEGNRVDFVTKRPIEAVQQEHTETWMSIPGVIGTAVGLKDNEKVIKVLVVKMTDEIRSEIPTSVEGYRIVVEETGEIRALNSESE